MKRILALLLSLMLAVTMAGMAYAATTSHAEFSVNSQHAAPGENLTVTVSLDVNTTVKSLGVLLDYDSSILTPVKGKWLLDGAVIADTGTPSDPYSSITFSAPTTVSGDILTYTFKVSDDAPEGYYTIGFADAVAKTVINGVETAVDVDVNPGTVGVYNYSVDLYMEDATVISGSEFYVYIRSDENIRVKSLMIEDFDFDRDVFTLLDAKWLVQDGFISDWNLDLESAVIAYTTETLVNDDILQLHFSVKEDVEGDFDFGFNAVLHYVDGIEHTAYVNCIPGTVTVQNYVLGDMNDDGEVDSNDAIYLLRHTMNATRYPIIQYGDINDDGDLNSNDAIYLLRHTMNPSRYQLHPLCGGRHKAWIEGK